LQLKEKVKTLEQSLTHLVREFEEERGALIVKSENENESSR